MDGDGANKKVYIHLLKTRSSPNDNYEDYFRSLIDGEYVPTFIPVLEHKFRQNALENFPYQPEIFHRSFAQGKTNAAGIECNAYGGIIFTSQRAVDAFARVTKGLELARTEQLVGEVQNQAHKDGLYRFIYEFRPVLYAVGPATARSLQALNLPCFVLGEETGNGEALAKFMLKDFNDRFQKDYGSQSGKPGLLFLVGEQRRDIIPKTLQSETLPLEERIQVDELVVYETIEMASFQQDFSEVWSRHAAEIQWVVVFSPQGCRALLRILGVIDEDGRKILQEPSTVSGGRKTFIATIGPTTRDYLRHEFGVEPDACAAKPSPEGVGDAIKAYLMSIS